jgi:hypothetical protein
MPLDMKTTEDQAPTQTSLCRLNHPAEMRDRSQQTASLDEDTAAVTGGMQIRARTLALPMPHTHAPCRLGAQRAAHIRDNRRNSPLLSFVPNLVVPFHYASFHTFALDPGGIEG